jgi:ribose transport system substrate-binding protein
MIRKVCTGMLAVLLVFAGCGNKTAAPKAGDAYNIYMISMDQVDQHWVNLNKGCEKAVAEFRDQGVNINYQWSAPEAKDDIKQIECINNAVAAGANAILIAANSADAPVAALEEAIDAGVTVVYVDAQANAPAAATLTTDNKAAGYTAGTVLLEALAEVGITSGSIGIIGTYSSTASTVAREEGFRQAFDGKGYTLLETQYCEGDPSKGQNIATNFITQGAVGFFASNEASTLGAGNAIRENGGQVLAVGFDKSDVILSHVENGYLVGVMAQNPDVMGYEGIKAAVTVLQGKTVANKVIDTGVSVIGKSNVNSFR